MDTIYVAFKHGDKWTKRFLKKGFSHCSVILCFANGWLEVEPTQRILFFNELNDKKLAQYTKVLKVNIKDFSYPRFPFKLCTCITLVEYMLGKKLGALTPYSLYKKLTGKFRNQFNTEEII